MKNIFILISLIWVLFSHAQNTTSYQYNNDGWLMQSSDGTKTQTYTYDALGNRLGYIVVSNTNLPDVVVINQNINPDNVVAGETTEIVCRVKNQGTYTTTNPSRVAYYLSENSTFDGSDTFLGFDAFGTIGINQYEDQINIVNIPEFTASGTYYVLFFADDEFQIAESDENNNVSSKQITVTELSYEEDITVTNASASPDVVSAGSNIILTATQNYTGYQAITTLPSIELSYVLSTDCILSYDDIFLGADFSDIGSDNPSETESRIVTIPASLSEGSYYILFSGDAANAIDETDEDNTVCVGITVSSCEEVWQNVGIEGFSSGSASDIIMEFNSNGIPYVAFIDGDYSNKTSVMKFEGNSWILVGNPGFSHVETANLGFAISNNNTPFVAYTDVNNSHKVSVKKFIGSSWVNVGSLDFTNNTDNVLDLAINNNGNPYVIFDDGGNNWKMSVMMFNGLSWEYAGTPGFSDGNYQVLEFDNNNYLHVAYEDENVDMVNVKKLSGSSWISVGATNFSAGNVESISLDFNNSNTPYVAYRDVANNQKTSVMKFVGGSWIYEGSPGFSPEGGTYYQKIIVADNNTPYVSFRYNASGNNNATAVMKYNGSSWVNVGETDFTNVPAYYQKLAMVDNIPYLSYMDGSNSSRATVMKFDCDNNINADFYANNTTGSQSSTFSFIDASSNIPTEWNWVFTPNTITYINGTNSTSQNPEVLFNETGTYTVSLTASNDVSSDTETKSNYIEIVSEYSLSINIIGNGTVDLNPEGGVYNYGEVVSLTAIPEEGWQFDGWSNDLIGNTNPESITMDSDKTVTATFSQIQYSLSVNIVGNGIVDIDPTGGIYNYGEIVTLTAIPDDEWQFDGWSGSFNGITNPLSILMNSNKTITATFIQIQHTLSVNIVGNGAVDLDPDGGIYNYGEIVSLTAAPDDGWQFEGWSVDLSGNTNPESITMDSDKNVTATFTQVQYTLTVNIEGSGIVELDPAGGIYNSGEIVTLTAIPDNGWQFDGWSEDLNGNTNPGSITMDLDKTVTATFSEAQYTLSINIIGNGTVNLDPSGGIYNYGEEVTLTAIPDDGWQFNGWSDDLSGNTNPETITMDSDKLVTAIFSPIQYSLTVSIIGNGSVDLSPSGGTYNSGEEVILTAISDDGWQFVSWSGNLSGNTNPETITMDSDKLVSAIFSPIQYSLSVSIIGNGNVDLSPTGGIYNSGEEVTLTAIPDDGWQFNGWSGNLSGNTNPETITMDSDKIVTATFSQDQFTLTVNIEGNGIVELDPAGGIYTSGEIVTLNAIPDNGWQFDGWDEDLSGNNNPESITMDSDKTVTAVFSCGTVSIPDANFEQALIDLGYDDVIDGVVIYCNIENIISLNVSTREISNLTGIEYFAALENLVCYSNQISVLDLSMNIELKNLDCRWNQLTTLNVVSSVSLLYLLCGGNLLTELDINSNVLLKSLYLENNQVANIDVSNNPQLESLLCYNNLLTTLDINANTALETFSCFNNQLTELDVSNNTELTIIGCYDNYLTSLDLTNNSELSTVYCYNNQLTYFDIRNGNNTNIETFSTQFNLDLICIYVDDAEWSEINWPDIEENSTFVETEEECELLGEEYILLEQNIHLYPNPAKTRINVEVNNIEISRVTIYNNLGEIEYSNTGKPNSISVEAYPKGVYYVRFDTEEGDIIMKKIIKE